jgi:hypothetical protein
MNKKSAALGILAGVFGIVAYVSQASADPCKCWTNSSTWNQSLSASCFAPGCPGCANSRADGTSTGAVSSGHNVILASLGYVSTPANCRGFAKAIGLDSGGTPVTNCYSPFDYSSDGNTVAGPASGTPCDAAVKHQLFQGVEIIPPH